MLYDFCLSLKAEQKRRILLSLDILWMCMAFVLAHALVQNRFPDGQTVLAALPYLVLSIPLAVALTVHFGLHRLRLNAYQQRSVLHTGVVAAVFGLTGAALSSLPFAPLPQSGFVVVAMSYLILSVGSRILLRSVLMRIYSAGEPRARVLIYGAGQTGQQLAAALSTDKKVQPIAFVDDNPRLQSMTVMGLYVHAPTQIAELIRTKGIERVVLAMPSVSQPAQARIARELRNIGAEVLALPSFAELVEKGEITKKIAPVEFTNLMGRNRLEEELPGVSDAYAGKNILVTGAGGSIGSELCRQLLACGPMKLVLMDHSELSLYNIERELAEMTNQITVVPVLGSICEASLVRHTLERHEINVVMHAAAYKHVPMVESNLIEGMRNNVFGTKILADEARAANVESFTLVSSDKAVRPVSAMGCSKRLAELIVQDLATRSQTTTFSMVRFGNVLGSSGSVIPLFQDQIARGGPVTVTHGDVTRYFMTIPEAVRLVLLAGSFARDGDVFVLDMGEPVPIRKVAKQMIEGAGFTVRSDENPKGDIEIQITGLRPGEKLHEELLIGSDMLTTPHPKILRAQEGCLSEIEVANVIQNLRKAIDIRDLEAVQSLLAKWIEKSNVEKIAINQE
jgi:FlaA1/EpsC-like NDP-sugar epimerase